MSHPGTQTEIPGIQRPSLVVSASRRTDLVSCHPDYLIEKLRDYPPDRVHTLVIWTKNPENMIVPGKLREVLSAYAQVYVHLTITGLGGSLLEPNIPAWKTVSNMVPNLADMVKGAQRITWRFDPLIEVETENGILGNFPLFSNIAGTIGRYGITTCRTSWVEPYKKVTRRLEKKNIRLRILSSAERQAQARELEAQAKTFAMALSYCAMAGFPRSRCIDGELFSRLHPDGLPCSGKRARGQRRLCGCTESLDIGWYSQKCGNGCLYCYAEPLIK